ncbi:MAG TPA: ATP-binding protein [Rhizomicrobium sp.]|jgi:signal transduction histidine kinase|nr:ATP-binding protein [Rhizomicrobium sp.]
MKLWPLEWWPRTMAAQLIVVTAAAVMVSNLGVAAWFELSRERQTESALTERLLDRAVSASTLMKAIPAKQRDAAAHAMSSVLWHFQVIHGKTLNEPMDPTESALAAKLRTMLPPQRQNQPIDVQINAASHRPSSDPNQSNADAIIEITLPVVRGTELVTTFYRPPSPTWPTEIIVAALAAVLTASVAAAFIARRVAKPLSELSAAATAAALGKAAPRVPEEGPADVRRAASAFNAMTDQVKRTLESQRQLLSAVGHDLRTPITAMRINIEFVEDAELRERLETNLSELQELTEAVLSAARGAGGEQTRNVDLAALIESVCADLDDLGEAVTWQPHEPAPLNCRPNEIRRAVRNLVENAVAYGTRARARLEETKSEYAIVVNDDGPGIPDADRARVFEPFVRLETSRNAETGGTGLGLTLVKAIAEGHGGSIELENRPEGGLRATLRLPRGVAAA